MRLSSLKHLAGAVSAIAPEVRIIVFGSSSALCSHPELPEVTDSYPQTLDADFIIDPWDQGLAQLLSDTLGKDSGFFEHFKYYADIVRPAAFDNFPPDFRERLVPLEGCPRVFALDPHDMAVAKLFAGRPKDIRLLAFLLATNRLDEAKVRKLLWDTPMEESGSCGPMRCWIRWWQRRRSSGRPDYRGPTTRWSHSRALSRAGLGRRVQASL